MVLQGYKYAKHLNLVNKNLVNKNVNISNWEISFSNNNQTITYEKQIEETLKAIGLRSIKVEKKFYEEVFSKENDVSLYNTYQSLSNIAEKSFSSGDYNYYINFYKFTINSINSNLFYQYINSSNKDFNLIKWTKIFKIISSSGFFDQLVGKGDLSILHSDIKVFMTGSKEEKTETLNEYLSVYFGKQLGGNNIENVKKIIKEEMEKYKKGNYTEAQLIEAIEEALNEKKRDKKGNETKKTIYRSDKGVERAKNFDKIFSNILDNFGYKKGGVAYKLSTVIGDGKPIGKEEEEKLKQQLRIMMYSSLKDDSNFMTEFATKLASALQEAIGMGKPGSALYIYSSIDEDNRIPKRVGVEYIGGKTTENKFRIKSTENLKKILKDFENKEERGRIKIGSKDYIEISKDEEKKVLTELQKNCNDLSIHIIRTVNDALKEKFDDERYLINEEEEKKLGENLDEIIFYNCKKYFMIDVEKKTYYRALYKDKKIEPFNWGNFMRNLFPTGFVQGTQGTIGEIFPAAILKMNPALKNIKVTGQDYNDIPQQLHADLYVDLDGYKVGIQSKQYNSTEENLNPTFYETNLKIFSNQLKRYLDIEKINKITSSFANKDEAIGYIRYVSYISAYNRQEEIERILFSCIDNFFRISDTGGLTNEKGPFFGTNVYFYFYNFRLVPVSLIIAIILKSVKEYFEAMKKSMGMFFNFDNYYDYNNGVNYHNIPKDKKEIINLMNNLKDNDGNNLTNSIVLKGISIDFKSILAKNMNI